MRKPFFAGHILAALALTTTLLSAPLANAQIVDFLKNLVSPQKQQEEQPDEEKAELRRLWEKETPDKFFRDNRPNYDKALYAAAIAIHSHKTLTAAELEAVRGKANDRVNEDMTLFFYASYQRNLKAMSQLLAVGADPMLPMRPKEYAASPFVEDVAKGSKKLATDMLAVLLDHGLDPNIRTGMYHAPLAVTVAEHGNLNSFRLLADRGADLWAEQRDARPIRYSAMTNAADSMNYEMLGYAIDKGFFKNADPKQISEVIKSIDKVWLRNDSVSRAVVAITRKLVEATGYPGDEHSRYILDFGTKHFAGETLVLTFPDDDGAYWQPFDRDLEGLLQKMVYDERVDPAEIERIKPKINQRMSRNSTLLTNAINYNCNLRTIELLLAAGADPTMGDNSLAEIAATNGMSGTCERGALLDLYLKYGGNPNARILQWGMPLVARAAQYEQYDLVEQLVGAGADPWARPRGRFERSAMEILVFQAGGDSEPGNLEMLSRFADKGLFRNAPSEPFAGFMAMLEERCGYYSRFGDIFKKPLHKIIIQSGYKTDNACVRRMAVLQ